MDLLRLRSDPALFQRDVHVPGLGRFGDVVQPFQVERFAVVNPCLLAVVRGEKPPFAGFADFRTKGASKDTDHAINILFVLAFSPHAVRIQVGAGDQQQADEVRLIMRDVIRCDAPVNTLLSQLLDVQKTQILNRHTGSVCEILTSDNLTSHGSRPTVLLIDELSHISDKEFAETLMDNADKMAKGFRIVASNAGFDPSWQLDWKRSFEESTLWRVMEYREPARWISEEALADSRRRNSAARFDRLWGGVWVVDGGDALDLSDVDACFERGVAPHASRLSGHTYTAGCDLSIKRDFSSLVIVAKDRDGRYSVARRWLWRPSGGSKIDLEAVEQTIVAASKRYRLRDVGIDPFQAELLAARCRRAGVRIRTVPQTGRQLVAQASALIEEVNSHNLDIPEDEQMRFELRNLRTEERAYGMRLVSDRSAERGHGDLVSGLSIGLALAREVKVARIHSLDQDAIAASERRFAEQLKQLPVSAAWGVLPPR